MVRKKNTKVQTTNFISNHNHFQTTGGQNNSKSFTGTLTLLQIKFESRGEDTGEWRRLHNEELNDLYSSPNIIRVIKSRRMRWAGHVARMGEETGAYKFLVGRPEVRRPLGRPRRRWEGNIKMDLQEEGWGHGLN
jgi:hypothetical protein